jgi:hypothetical protein
MYRLVDDAQLAAHISRSELRVAVSYHLLDKAYDLLREAEVRLKRSADALGVAVRVPDAETDGTGDLPEWDASL